MTIARGQMNRQLYADGGVQTLTDILEPSTKEMVRELMDEDEEIMLRLQELQKRPEYQYDETRPYEGPRDMRMSGGILSAPIINNRVNAFGGFGGFIGDVVGGVGDFLGDAADTVGDVVGSVGDAIGDVDLGDVATAAAFIYGGPQAAAMVNQATGGTGNKYIDTGLQLYSMGSGVSGDSGGGVFGTGSGGTFGTPSGGIPSIPGVPSDITQALKTYSTMPTNRGPGKIGGDQQPSSTAGILGTLLNTAISAYGAKKAYDEQKKENELRRQQYEEERKRYDEFLAERAKKRRQYYGEESLPSLPVSNREISKSDVVGRRGASFGGMVAKAIQLNPQLITPLLQQSNQASPIDITMDVRNRSGSFGDFIDENGNGIDDREEMFLRGAMKKGGITNLNIRTNPEGVKEIDYREEGGFVPPVGIKEKADDIPAMLSNNEFVFTADAVRGAGKGNVNEGAKKMYALMKKLESGGRV